MLGKVEEVLLCIRPSQRADVYISRSVLHAPLSIVPHIRSIHGTCRWHAAWAEIQEHLLHLHSITEANTKEYYSTLHRSGTCWQPSIPLEPAFYTSDWRSHQAAGASPFHSIWRNLYHSTMLHLQREPGAAELVAVCISTCITRGQPA